MRGKKPDLVAARSALDSICRLNGYDAPRRTESLNLNLHAMGAGQLAQQLQATIQALPASERAALLRSDPAIETTAESEE